MEQVAVVIKVCLLDGSAWPQTVRVVPRINDTYLFRGQAYRVSKVAHADLQPPLVYIGEPRELTETEKRHLW